MKIKSLHSYPVKGLRGIDHSEMQMTMLGPAYDREWMITDAKGRFITQRTHPHMAQIETAIDAKFLKLSAQGKSISIPLSQEGAYSETTVFTTQVMGLEQSREANDWLSDFFKSPVRLFRYGDNSKRLVNSKYTEGKEIETRFTDSRPILVISEKSLEVLNTELTEKVPMNRFRANIILEGTEAWGEDTFTALQLGSVVQIRNSGECSRCKVTTVDQIKGVVTGPEPLNTLSRIRKKDGKVNFGCYYYPMTEGTISIGDQVRLI